MVKFILAIVLILNGTLSCSAPTLSTVYTVIPIDGQEVTIVCNSGTHPVADVGISNANAVIIKCK